MSDWPQNGTAAFAEHVAQDETSDDGAQVATPPQISDMVATLAGRNARPSRTRRRNNGHVPGDLPALLHRHLAAMGPAEAVHALDALEHLTSTPSAADGRIAPAWLTQLGSELDTLRDGPSIRRLVAMLVDLVPVVLAADNDAAVGAVIGFARAQTTAAVEAATDRQRRRR